MTGAEAGRKVLAVMSGLSRLRVAHDASVSAVSASRIEPVDLLISRDRDLDGGLIFFPAL
jgi:hypothetical protein